MIPHVRPVVIRVPLNDDGSFSEYRASSPHAYPNVATARSRPSSPFPLTALSRLRRSTTLTPSEHRGSTTPFSARITGLISTLSTASRQDTTAHHHPAASSTSLPPHRRATYLPHLSGSALLRTSQPSAVGAAVQGLSPPLCIAKHPLLDTPADIHPWPVPLSRPLCPPPPPGPLVRLVRTTANLIIPRRPPLPRTPGVPVPSEAPTQADMRRGTKTTMGGPDGCGPRTPKAPKGMVVMKPLKDYSDLPGKGGPTGMLWQGSRSAASLLSGCMSVEGAILDDAPPSVAGKVNDAVRWKDAGEGLAKSVKEKIVGDQAGPGVAARSNRLDRAKPDLRPSTPTPRTRGPTLPQHQFVPDPTPAATPITEMDDGEVEFHHIDGLPRLYNADQKAQTRGMATVPTIEIDGDVATARRPLAVSQPRRPVTPVPFPVRRLDTIEQSPSGPSPSEEDEARWTLDPSRRQARYFGDYTIASLPSSGDSAHIQKADSAALPVGFSHLHQLDGRRSPHLPVSAGGGGLSITQLDAHAALRPHISILHTYALSRAPSPGPAPNPAPPQAAKEPSIVDLDSFEDVLAHSPFSTEVRGPATDPLPRSPSLAAAVAASRYITLRCHLTRAYLHLNALGQVKEWLYAQNDKAMSILATVDWGADISVTVPTPASGGDAARQSSKAFAVSNGPVPRRVIVSEDYLPLAILHAAHAELQDWWSTAARELNDRWVNVLARTRTLRQLHDELAGHVSAAEREKIHYREQVWYDTLSESQLEITLRSWVAEFVTMPGEAGEEEVEGRSLQMPDMDEWLLHERWRLESEFKIPSGTMRRVQAYVAAHGGTGGLSASQHPEARRETLDLELDGGGRRKKRLWSVLLPQMRLMKRPRAEGSAGAAQVVPEDNSASTRSATTGAEVMERHSKALPHIKAGHAPNPQLIDQATSSTTLPPTRAGRLRHPPPPHLHLSDKPLPPVPTDEASPTITTPSSSACPPSLPPRTPGASISLRLDPRDIGSEPHLDSLPSRRDGPFRMTPEEDGLAHRMHFTEVEQDRWLEEQRRQWAADGLGMREAKMRRRREGQDGDRRRPRPKSVGGLLDLTETMKRVKRLGLSG